MSQSKPRIALALLEDGEGRVAMQLRAAIPTIANPDRWGFFGGHIEEGESPLEGAVREVQEELTCRVDPAKMRFLAEGRRATDIYYYLFHYPIGRELDDAILTEGQRWAFLSPEQIRAGEVDGKEIVAYHREYILTYWNGDYDSGSGTLN